MPGPLSCQSLGLVGWWKFDAGSGTMAADSSGSGNTGTLVNSTSWASGNFGSAVSVNTASQSQGVSVSPSSSIDFGANQDFTISLWVKTNQAAAENLWSSLICHDDVSNPRTGYEMFLHDSNNDSRWGISMFSSGNGYGAFGSHNVADGNWHHLVGMRKGDQIITFEDGVLANQQQGTAASLARNTTPLGIGNDGKFNDSLISWTGFIGQLDDVRIYNRALSAAEVQALYNWTGP
jgi:hypothetical protein